MRTKPKRSHKHLDLRPCSISKVPAPRARELFVFDSVSFVFARVAIAFALGSTALHCGGAQNEAPSPQSREAQEHSEEPFSTQAPGASSGSRPEDSAIEARMQEAQRGVRTCTSSRSGAMVVRMHVDGGSGSIREASVEDPKLKAQEQKCIEGVLKKIRFDPFGRPELEFVYPFALGGSLSGYVGTQGSTGILEAPVIEGEIMKHSEALRTCYDQCCSQDPNAVGQIEVQFTISPQGRIAEARVVKSTIGHVSMETCIVQAVRSWQFPKPKGGKVVVRYPLRFFPATQN